MEKRVLVVEDEENIRSIIKDYLAKEGYDIIEAQDGKVALEKIEQQRFDLAILDVMLPYVDGWTLCRKVKQKGEIPVIFLTARSEEYDELMGFDVGADDYVKKPFSPLVLVARVNKLLNQQVVMVESNEVIRKDVLEIDKDGRRVKIDQQPIELTNKEFGILLYLVENEGRVLSRDAILNTVWGYDFIGDTRVVDNHIKKIRKSLGEYAYFIRTVFGAGYLFEV